MKHTQNASKRATAWAVGLAVAGFALASPLRAQNLVNNPGFETGDFTGWLQSGNTGATGVRCGAGIQHSGSCAAYLGPVGSNGFLIQEIVPTTPGAPYDINFWLSHPFSTVPPNAQFYAYWNGVLFFSSLGGPFPYTQYGTTMLGRLGFPDTQLRFEFREDPDYWYLDDVCVARAGTVCPLSTGVVPEPSSLALLGTGVIGLFGVLRRRRNLSD